MALRRKTIDKVVEKDTPKLNKFKREFSIVGKKLTEQISIELQNDRLFLVLAGWCNANGYSKVSKYFFRKSEKSRDGAVALIKFLQDYSIEVKIPTSSEVTLTDLKDVEDVFQSNLNAELITSDHLSDLYFAAHDDRAAIIIPHIFNLLDRQRRSEKIARNLADVQDGEGSLTELIDSALDV